MLAPLSSLIAGFGDLALYLLLNLGGGFVQGLGQIRGWPGMERLGAEILASLMPGIDLGRLLATTAMSWYPTVAYASTVTICLALAIVVVNRKEISYASG